MLVLNSHSAVLDLYEKRAPTFSDRPVNPAFEIMNYNWMFSTMSYNPWWRLHRRTFHQFFHQREIQKYRPILQQEALVFLRRLSANPKSFLQDTRWFFGSVIIWISYGVNDPEYNKSLIEKAEVMIKGFSEAALPGQFLVNVFPSLSYVPTWFPGTGWKKRLLHLAEETTNALVDTWNDAKERVRNGYQSEYPNVATGLIQSLPDEDHPEYADKEIVARNTSVISYAAGADTTVSSAHALFLALAMNPQVQLRAQEEIDAVVGTDRLPTPDDVARLPYIQAIVKELTRWHTVAPLGVPRISREDAEYRGYFIPKGTILFANTWAIMHNPEVFENPMEFNPERYLKDGKINPNVLDPEAAAFGYGRRICPGRYLSNEALGYFAASLLSVFDVQPPKDEFGNRVQLSLTIASPKELMA
ncbi:hypothetical protein CC1G_04866 [Coprinopsis cinerea okayama7|uniref:Cytochrome P450 n=1 Tax=Coprinopsis cinerea (strain Okayama-7 / 130 / ATCC MYA-4618 / FGSC 9003) TaxID=240176 RepID=A8PFV2_COPC7|nr:hypothetical protein CC1G_04866 [Coprinopsis cinerea okayama7\|eukprot:XP_001841022.1 hypothetical protein CC1G_04866 [Coprinopsis cinerea okayama7\